MTGNSVLSMRPQRGYHDFLPCKVMVSRQKSQRKQTSTRQHNGGASTSGFSDFRAARSKLQYKVSATGTLMSRNNP